MKSEFIKELISGSICLHPTDTIPGITVYPQKEFLESLSNFKNRDINKPFLFLAPSYDKAISYYSKLSPLWERALKSLWPGPLTVIYQTNEEKKNQIEYHNIAIRVPKLKESANWFHEVLNSLDCLLPSTSINFSGEVPISTWEEASMFLKAQKNCFVPLLKNSTLNQKPISQPSTIIQITGDQTYKLIRLGSISDAQINSILKTFQ